MSRFLTWCHMDADGASHFQVLSFLVDKKGKLVLGNDEFVGSGSKSPLSPRDDFFKSNNCH